MPEGYDSFPLEMGDVLRLMARHGTLRHLHLIQVKGGYQASFRRANGAYSIGIKEDPLDAILHAIHPGWGHPWEEVLGVPDADREAPSRDEIEDDDVEDLM